jgi:hypothetical protein
MGDKPIKITPLQKRKKKGGSPTNEYEKALIHNPIQHPLYITYIKGKMKLPLNSNGQ